MECNVNIPSTISELVITTTTTNSSEQTICIVPTIDANVIAVVAIA